jgi:hypothetical protein
MSESAEKYGNGAEKRPLTAVEWLEDVYNKQGRILPQQFEQAKVMHKEEIMDAVDSWVVNGNIKGEQYYNETFGKP